MKDVKKILLATDFSSGATAALKQGRRLAESNGLQLDILHVADTHDLQELAEALNQSKEATQKQFEETALEQMNTWLKNAGIQFDGNPVIVSGDPLASILKHIEEEQVQLLMVGLTGQEHEGDKAAVGLIANKLIRSSPVRVLIVHPRQKEDFKQIVACVDFSETSREVVAQAIQVAKAEQSHLSVIHVFKAPWHRLHYKAPSPTSDVGFQKRFETALTQKLQAFAPVPDSVPHYYHLCDASNDGYGIADFARRSAADLIVIGTQGKSNLRYIFTGSTAERVLRELPCSALVIKPVK